MLLKGLDEMQTAPQPRPAAEMVLVRLAYVADLPPPGRAGAQGGRRRARPATRRRRAQARAPAAGAGRERPRPQPLARDLGRAASTALARSPAARGLAEPAEPAEPCRSRQLRRVVAPALRRAARGDPARPLSAAALHLVRFEPAGSSCARDRTRRPTSPAGSASARRMDGAALDGDVGRERAASRPWPSRRRASAERSLTEVARAPAGQGGARTLPRRHDRGGPGPADAADGTPEARKSSATK